MALFNEVDTNKKYLQLTIFHFHRSRHYKNMSFMEASIFPFFLCSPIFNRLKAFVSISQLLIHFLFPFFIHCFFSPFSLLSILNQLMVCVSFYNSFILFFIHSSLCIKSPYGLLSFFHSIFLFIFISSLHIKSHQGFVSFIQTFFISIFSSLF